MKRKLLYSLGMLLVVVLFAALVNIASPQQDTGNGDNATLATTVSNTNRTPTPAVVIGAVTGTISGVNVSEPPPPPPLIPPLFIDDGTPTPSPTSYSHPQVITQYT